MGGIKSAWQKANQFLKAFNVIMERQKESLYLKKVNKWAFCHFWLLFHEIHNCFMTSKRDSKYSSSTHKKSAYDV